MENLLIKIDGIVGFILSYQVVALWQAFVLFPFLAVYYLFLRKSSYKSVKNLIFTFIALSGVFPLLHYLLSTSNLIINILSILDFGSGNNVFFSMFLPEVIQYQEVNHNSALNYGVFIRNLSILSIELLLILIICQNYLKNLIKYKRLTRSARLLNRDILTRSIKTNLRSPKVRFLASNEISTPVTSGIFKPVIIIPSDLVSEINSEKSLFVLIHELVHVKNRDTLFLSIAVLFWIFNFYNPLVWILLAMYSRYVELACDEEVLLIRNDSLNYARTLTSIACQRKDIIPLFYATGLITSKNFLKTRVVKILENGKDQESGRVYPLIRTLLLILVIATAIIIVPPGIGHGKLNPENVINLLNSSEVYDHKQIEVQPELIGGNYALYNYMLKNNLYPEEARQQGITGTVTAGFTVNQNGEVVSIAIETEEPAGFGFGNAVKSALEEMKYEPGKVDGNPISTHLKQTVRFALN